MRVILLNVGDEAVSGVYEWMFWKALLSETIIGDGVPDFIPGDIIGWKCGVGGEKEAAEIGE